ncbi:FAD/FMN-containing dehydrogenase [Bradyrhizobium sp. USDA 4516]
MNTQIVDAGRIASGGYRVDVSRGERVGRVSSEWFSRPADERYLSLDALARTVHDRANRSRTRVVESALIQVNASRADPERLALMLPGSDTPVAPTHWSFGQLASQVGAPAAYLRQLPASLAAINLQYGLNANRLEQIKTLETEDSRVELRAVTGPDYGRIYDHELVEAVQRIAGNGTGDTRWKVPGVLDWSSGIYNPCVDISKATTTLYASDRDVFLFLVDDLNPIEAGRLRDGSPDLYFRGFYCWNSEVGAKTLGMASFYLRAVCQNRNLWGVEDFEEITIRHSKYAAARFAHEAAPALSNFANSSPMPFVNGIKAARERIVARSDEDRTEFLRRRGFSKAETGKVIDAVLAEEGRPPESIFDFVQGITAVARDKPHQDVRLDMEGRAKKLLDRAA